MADTLFNHDLQKAEDAVYTQSAMIEQGVGHQFIYPIGNLLIKPGCRQALAL